MPSQATAASQSLLTSKEIAYLDPDLFITDRSLNARAYPAAAKDRYGDEEFKQLMKSIETNGVLQPVLYQLDESGQPHLRAGDRRLEAIKRLREAHPKDERFQTIPSIALNAANAPVIIQASYDENERRRKPSAMDDAYTIKLFEESGLKGGEIAKSMGKSQGWISQRKALLKLSEELQLKVHRGELDATVAYELSKKPVETQQAAAETLHEEAAERAEATPGKKSKGKVKVTGRGRGKKKSKLTRKTVKSAKVSKKGKLKTKSDKTVSRDGVHVFFADLGRDKKAGVKIQTLGKTVVAFMDGRITPKAARGRIDKLVGKK